MLCILWSIQNNFQVDSLYLKHFSKSQQHKHKVSLELFIFMIHLTFMHAVEPYTLFDYIFIFSQIPSSKKMGCNVVSTTDNFRKTLALMIHIQRLSYCACYHYRRY